MRNRKYCDAALDRMIIVMRCNGCRRMAYYWAEDLVKVVGRWHEVHVPPWPCSKCRTIEYMQTWWEVPTADKLQEGLTIRRPVKQVTKWIWRNERT